MTSTAAATALIADDEEAPRDQLEAALRRVWPGLGTIYRACHGIDAWDAYLAHEPDVCFLDIRMPGMSGLEVAQRIGGQTPVVLVTAFSEHAISAFDAGAIDYVLKPVEDERLARTVERLLMRLEAPAPAAAVAAAAVTPDALAATLARLLRDKRLVSPTPRLTVLQASVGREVKLIRLADVLYFESDARYTRVLWQEQHQTGDALLRMPLKELLPQLDMEDFWQVHRSAIVRAACISSAVRTGEGLMHLTLRGHPDTLPVSRHFQARFRGQ
jgi:DNA-binding LytR/AlgR family response regulator